MNLRDHRFKVLRMSILVVLGLMAFSVTAARAEGGFLEALTGLETATGEVDTLGVLEVSALSVEIDCTGFKVKEGLILGSGEATEKNIAHVELLYEGCSAYVTSPVLELEKTCLLFESAADRTEQKNPGNLMAKGLAEVFLHTDGTPYLKVKGTGAEGLFTMIFSSSCIGVPNGTKVKGSVVLKMTPGKEYAVKQLAEVADLKLFKNELLYGVNEAVALGSVWIKLSSGNEWAID